TLPIDAYGDQRLALAGDGGIGPPLVRAGAKRGGGQWDRRGRAGADDAAFSHSPGNARSRSRPLRAGLREPMGPGEALPGPARSHSSAGEPSSSVGPPAGGRRRRRDQNQENRGGHWNR